MKLLVYKVGIVLLLAFIALALGHVVKNTRPQPVLIAPKPDAIVLELSKAKKDDLIMVESPRIGEKVTNPIVISGKARGTWFFEASFPIVVTNWDGLIIGEGFATAVGDWMTEEYVPFTATISYDVTKIGPYSRGTLILKKDNPSGEPRFDNALEYQINFTEL
jgi:hypothetical protein